MTLDEKRKQIGSWLKESDGGRLWDLLCGLRGPDSPSERDNMSSTESTRAYAGRRKRKFNTVEVIREKAFFGACGGAARHHDSDHVTLPPMDQWDHFDRHVQRAASILGIKVVIEGTTQRGVEVKKEQPVVAPSFTPTVTVLKETDGETDGDDDTIEEFEEEDDE